MRVLFSSTWGYGHVFPMVPLAQAFQAAGHEVLWASSGAAPALVEAAGIDALAAGLDVELVAAAEQRVRAAMVDLRPEDKAAFTFPTLFAEAVAPPMVADLLPIARRWHPDLLIHEHAELAAPLVGAVLGLPIVTHAFGGGVPADFLSAAGERLAHVWAAYGPSVPPYAGSFGRAYVDICPPSVQTVPLAHVDRRLPLRPVIWTGPDAPPFELGRRDDRPLVYLTLGTVHNQAAVFSAAVRGLAGLDASIVVAVGRNGDPDALGPQPDNVQVRRWVDQREVLRHASVVVSHGGSGTFFGALAAGLPQLCVPQAADQFRNAAGLIRAGAGLVLPPDQMTPTAVRQAVRRLLDESVFRRAAGAVAQEIRSLPSPADVVTTLAALI